MENQSKIQYLEKRIDLLLLKFDQQNHIYCKILSFHFIVIFYHQQKSLHLQFDFIQIIKPISKIMQQAHRIVIDPVCLLGIGTFHEKNLPKALGASFGTIYAQQKQLNYQIVMSNPAGTDRESPQQILNRIIQYQSLRTIRSKNMINFLEEFVLIGWYCMGTAKYLRDNIKKYKSYLDKELSLRGAVYCLWIDSTGQQSPKLLIGEEQEKFSIALQPSEKICSDSMDIQGDDSAPYKKVIQKQKQLLRIYNQKLHRLQQMLKGEISQEKKAKILELLDNYERIIYHQNKGQSKQKTIEAINLSVLQGLSLCKKNLREGF